MKKIAFIFMLGVLAFSFNSYSQLKVNSSGYVGINQSYPSYNLDWFGTGRFWTTWGTLIFDSSGHGGVAVIYPGQTWNGALGRSDKRFNTVFADLVNTNYLEVNSDERIKENIADIDNPLEKLIKLRGVKYDFKEDYFGVTDPILKKKLKKQGENQLGFIAQEMKEVLPELISFDTTSDLYSIRYIGLIPILVEAIKEQQQMIKAQGEQIAIFEADCCNKEKSATLVGGDELKLDPGFAKLYQNTPNPFKDETTIRFEIPEEVGNAQIYICNMTGTLLKTITVNQRGEGSIIISGSEFNAGMYLYSLINDGKIIDTKQMLLTN